MNPEKQPDSTWSTPQPERLPRPTYWPAVFALSLVMILFGIVTHWIFSVVGLVLFLLSLSGWIGEMRHEQRNSRQ